MDSPEIHKKLQDIINESQHPGQHILIQTLTRGYRVEIGCASFAFERLGDMIEAINLFLDDQHDAQKAFNNHMSDLLGVDAPPQYNLTEPGGTIGLRDLRAGAARINYPEENTPG